MAIEHKSGVAMLFAETSGTGPRIVLVHGFAQNRNCWGRFRDLLVKDHQVVAVDAPGHGESDHDDADLWEAAELITEVGGEATYVGYSMGARMVLHAALARPDLVRSAVLISGTPGMTEGREARVSDDEGLAEFILTKGLDRFLARWLSTPTMAGTSQVFRHERLQNRPEGVAASLRNCGTGTQEPLWDRLGELAMPVVTITGSNDVKFGDIANRMPLPNHSIDGAGHSPHLSHPDDVAQIVTDSTV